MSTDNHLTTNQLDEDGFPITIGLPPNTGTQSAVNATNSEEAAQRAEDSTIEPPGLSSVEPDASEPDGVLSGYDLVADMMRRQDEVLGQLDDLNDRIELAIDQISAARKSEIEALNAESNQIDTDDHTLGHQRAA